MRKHILALLLLVPILLIPLVSCDGDVLGSLSDFMGKAGGNALLESGTLVVDTSQGATMEEAAVAIKALTPPPAPADPNALTPDEQADKDAYDEAYKGEVEKIQGALADALAAPGGTKATKLKEDMKKPALPTDAPAKVETKIAEIKTDLGVEIEIGTQGDLVAAILMVEAVEKGEKIKDALDDPAIDDPTDEELLEFISEALQVIEIVRTVSPANAVNLDTLISDMLGDDDLMNDLLGRSRATSRDSGEDEALTYIEPIFDMIIKAIGTDSTTGYIIPAGLTRLTSNFAFMRKAYESMAPALEKSKRELELTDVINYTLSVVFTEANGFFGTGGSGITFEKALNDVIDWQEKDKVGEPDFIDDIPDWEAQFDTYRTAYKARFDKIESTLRKLVAAVPSLDYLDEALDELFK